MKLSLSRTLRRRRRRHSFDDLECSNGSRVAAVARIINGEEMGLSHSEHGSAAGTHMSSSLDAEEDRVKYESDSDSDLDDLFEAPADALTPSAHRWKFSSSPPSRSHSFDNLESSNGSRVAKIARILKGEGRGLSHSEHGVAAETYMSSSLDAEEDRVRYESDSDSDLDDLFGTAADAITTPAHHDHDISTTPGPACTDRPSQQCSVAERIEQEEEDREEMILFFTGERSLPDIGIDLDALDGFHRWSSPHDAIRAKRKEQQQQQQQQQEQRQRSPSCQFESPGIDPRGDDEDEMLKFYIGERTLADVGIDLENLDQFRRWRPRFRLSSIAEQMVEADDAPMPLSPVRVVSNDDNYDFETFPDARTEQRAKLMRYYIGDIQLKEVPGINIDDLNSWGRFDKFRTNNDDADQSTARQQRVLKKSVSFTSIEIREYFVVLGDHPDCCSGAPLSLGWEYSENEPLDLDVYEHTRAAPRLRDNMIVPSFRRRYILKYYAGHTEQELIDAEKEVKRIRKQRGVSCVAPPPVQQKAEDVLNAAVKRMSRFRRSSSSIN